MYTLRMRFLWLSALFVVMTSGCTQSEHSGGKDLFTGSGVTGSTAGSASATGTTGDTSGSQSGTTGSSTGSTASSTPDAPQEKGLNPIQTRPPKDGEEVAVIETAQGRIVVMFFPEKAPNHVENFKKLAKSGFYDGTRFHRVMPGFMIQGGDPNSKNDKREDDGQGGPGYNLKQEFNDLKHVRGILSMARTPDPDGAGSQFFLMHAKYPSLDNQYTVFGRAVIGVDVIDKIVNLDRDGADNPTDNEASRVKSVKLAKWPVK